MIVTASSLDSVETATDGNVISFCSSRISWKVNFTRSVDIFDEIFYFAGIRLIASFFYSTFSNCEIFEFHI